VKIATREIRIADPADKAIVALRKDDWTLIGSEIRKVDTICLTRTLELETLLVKSLKANE
jgi:hypothetical protein